MHLVCCLRRALLARVTRRYIAQGHSVRQSVRNTGDRRLINGLRAIERTFCTLTLSRDYAFKRRLLQFELPATY